MLVSSTGKRKHKANFSDANKEMPFSLFSWTEGGLALIPAG